MVDVPPAAAPEAEPPPEPVPAWRVSADPVPAPEPAPLPDELPPPAPDLEARDELPAAPLTSVLVAAPLEATSTPAAPMEAAAPVVGTFDRGTARRGLAAAGIVRGAGFDASRAAGALAPSAGAVRSAGFDRAAAAGSRAPSPGAAQAAGFDRAAAPRATLTMAMPARVTLDTPVEVTFKPVADYTDEARARRIEGEVVIEVTFGASGEVSVVRVVESLGHGLDESASRAVSGIQFRPATRDGVPVEVRTLVRIEFRLA